MAATTKRLTPEQRHVLQIFVDLHNTRHRILAHPDATTQGALHHLDGFVQDILRGLGKDDLTIIVPAFCRRVAA